MPSARPEVARGALRGVRAAVVAAAALALAATAHVVAGGTLPPLPVLLVLVVPVAWGAVALTGRPLGRVTLTVALGGGQIALHEALMVLAAPTCGPLNAAAGMAGMHAVPPAGGPAALAGCARHTMSGTSVAWSVPGAMLAAHAVATVLTALLLAHADRALASVVTLVRVPLRRLTAVVAVVPGRGTRLVRAANSWHDVVGLASAVLDAAGGRRGPPVWSAAASTR